MTLVFDRQGYMLLGIVYGILFLASAGCWMWRRSRLVTGSESLADEVTIRIASWWVLTFVFTVALGLGLHALLVLFFFVTFLALREYITLIPTKVSDHRTLLWSFLAIAPVQYYLIGINWYGLYSIFIPVYAFLFIPTSIVLRGDSEAFLERAAKIQWGLMIGVYMVSHAPALVTLAIPGYEGQQYKLLFYLVFITGMSDVMQFVAGKLFGRRKIAPSVSPNKTWGGFLGGVIGSVVLGALLASATPFNVWQSAGFAFVIAVTGFFGGLTMSAIKRDHGVKDYGHLIPGHGGVLDRIDSLCFAAPLFFHLTRYLFAV